MLVAQLLPFAKNLCTRKWSDEDIIEDVQFLRDELNINFQSLTYVCDKLLLLLELDFHPAEHTTNIFRSCRQGTCLGRLCMNQKTSGRRTPAD
jgi:hypothetical protein